MKIFYYHFISKKCQEDIAHTLISRINKYILPCWCILRYFFKTLAAVPPLSLLQFSLISLFISSFFCTNNNIVIYIVAYFSYMAFPMMSRLMKNTMMKNIHMKNRSKTLATFFHSPVLFCVALWSL